MPLTGLSFHDDVFNNPCSSFSSFISSNFKRLRSALMTELRDMPHTLFLPHSTALLSAFSLLPKKVDSHSALPATVFFMQFINDSIACHYKVDIKERRSPTLLQLNPSFYIKADKFTETFHTVHSSKF